MFGKKCVCHHHDNMFNINNYTAVGELEKLSSPFGKSLHFDAIGTEKNTLENGDHETGNYHFTCNTACIMSMFMSVLHVLAAQYS